jgi:hypothetical protein
MSKRNHRGDTLKPARFLQLHEWFMGTPAWQSLNGNERALYIELKRRYNGRNNGRIPYSAREAVEALHIGKSTVAEALRTLQDRGFIVAENKGTFHRKIRHASEWRLTEEPSEMTRGVATKNFVNWHRQPDREKTRDLTPDRARPEIGPIGTSGRTVDLEKRRYGT